MTKNIKHSKGQKTVSPDLIDRALDSLFEKIKENEIKQESEFTLPYNLNLSELGKMRLKKALETDDLISSSKDEIQNSESPSISPGDINFKERFLLNSFSRSKNDIIVGLDIGTTKVCAIVGTKNEYGKLEVLGMGKAVSDGVIRGIVTNIDKTVMAIEKAIAEASEQSGIEINVVNVGIAGQHIKSSIHHGSITRDRVDDKITVEDINRLTNDIYKIVMPPGCEIIHVMPQDYIVDYEDGIKDPVGMSGVKLEADFHVITAQTNAIRNINKCVKRANLEIDDLILEPLASSMSVLSDEEKEAGVCLIDIGGGTTDVALFHDSIIRHTAVIPFGGNIITNDIKKALKVIQGQAELLKNKFGKAIAEEVDPNEIVSIPDLGNKPPKVISIRNLAHIIEARMEEIIELVHAEIITSGYASKLAGGIVITGGGAQLAYIKQLFEYMTGMDARIGYPNECLGKSKIEAIKSPMYATTVGLVLSGFRAIDDRISRYMENKSNTISKYEDKAKKRLDFFNELINTRSSSYMFELPSHHKSIIKVIGVGGGGSNAVKHMYDQGIRDVEFAVCNTDAQALKKSPIPNKLQIGVGLAEGHGAGANPDTGKNAAIESKDQIKQMLGDDTKMVFITAGMGGGTGTGAAPVIAKIAKDMDLLTVGIVTAPFSFEGKKKATAANKGIEELKKNCDVILVIPNDKLREIHGNLPISRAFGEADNILTTAAKGIAEIITVPGYVNVDFMDVQTIMKGAGAAVMGSALAVGEGRALRAAEMAISSPLLKSKDIRGAKRILLSIVSGEEAELQMGELTEITEYIQEKAGDDAEVIFGHGIDREYGQNIGVTIIATGFENPELKAETVVRKKVIDLESNQEIESSHDDSLSPKHESQTLLFDTTEEVKSEEPQPEAKEEPQDEPEERTSGYSFLSRLADKYEIEEFPPATPQEPEIEERNQALDNDFQEERNKNFLEMKRAKLQEQARIREERHRGASTPQIDNINFKEKMEIPAYQRKRIRLTGDLSSSERSVSRFNLNDDDDIMGDNEFSRDSLG